MTATTPTAQLLEHYLPTHNGRTPAERLQAIAGKALTDGLPRIQTRLNTTLTPHEREDAHHYLIIAGLNATRTYNPNLDKGTTTGIPQDIRFGRFAYLRMRLALIDWERKTYGDRRPGRTPHPDLIPHHPDLDQQPDHIDIPDLIATKDQLERWHTQARHEHKTLTTWIIDTLNNAVDRRAA